MKILLDHNVDQRFRHHLLGHDVCTTHEMGWDALLNGVLLKTAANAGIQVLITVDKKMEHEQNLRTLPVPIVVLNARSNVLSTLNLFAPSVIALLDGPIDNLLFIVEPDGYVIRLTSPRH